MIGEGEGQFNPLTPEQQHELERDMAGTEAAAQQTEKQFFGETLAEHAKRMEDKEKGGEPQWDETQEQNAAK